VIRPQCVKQEANRPITVENINQRSNSK